MNNINITANTTSMKDLKCALKECTYNKSFCCCAHEISVTGSAACSSYSPDEEKKSELLFEIGVDDAKPNYSVDTKVNCTADCVFNKHDKCVAVGITVLSESDQSSRPYAECVTFVKA